MERGKSKSMATKPFAAARPQPLVIARSSDIPLDTSQHSSGLSNNACPSAEPSLPPTPASAVDDKYALLQDDQQALMKRKRSTSRGHDRNFSDGRSCKSPRVAGMGGLAILDGLHQLLDEEVFPLKSNLQDMQSQQDNIKEQQTEQGKRLDVAEDGVKQEFQALRLVTDTLTAHIASLDRTCVQRSEEHVRHIKDLTAQHDALVGTVHGDTTQLKAMNDSTTDNSTLLDKIQNEVKVYKKTQLLQYRNQKSDTTKQIEKVEEGLKVSIAKMEQSLKELITKNEKDVGGQITGVKEEVGLQNVKVQELSDQVAKADTEFKIHKMDVNAELEERIPEALTAVNTRIMKIDRELETIITEDEMQRQLSMATAANNTANEKSHADLKALIKTSEGNQAQNVEGLRADLTSRLDKQYLDVDKRISQTSTSVGTTMKSLQESSDALKVTISDYDDRLSHLTKEHLEHVVPTQQRVSVLEASHEQLKNDVGSVQSSFQAVRKTTDDIRLEAATYNDNTSKHASDISKLQIRVETLENKVATTIDPPSPFTNKFAPQTPAAHIATPYTSCDSPSDLATDVRYLKERDVNNKKYVDRHEAGLLLHNQKFQAYKERMSRLEKEVEELKRTNLETQTASQQRMAELEKQHAMDREQNENRLNDAFRAMQSMAEDIGTLKNARRASVPDQTQHRLPAHDLAPYQIAFERMDQRIEDLSREVDGSNTISKSRHSKTERLVSEWADSVLKLRSETQESIQTSKVERAAESAQLRKDAEGRFETAMVAIQDESQRSRTAQEQALDALRLQLDTWCEEAAKKAQEATASADSRAEESRKNMLRQVRELLEVQCGRIDDIEAEQRRASSASAQAPAPENQAPTVDREELKALRSEVETSIQALNERVDGIEAARQAPSAAKQLSSSTKESIKTLRFDVDTLQQNRQTRDVEATVLRRKVDALEKSFHEHREACATKNQLSTLKTSHQKLIDDIKVDVKNMFTEHAYQMDQRCLDRKELAHHELVNRIAGVPSPSSYPSPPLQTPPLPTARQRQPSIAAPFPGFAPQQTHQTPPPTFSRNVRKQNVAIGSAQAPHAQNAGLMYPAHAQAGLATPGQTDDTQTLPSALSIDMQQQLLDPVHRFSN